MTNAVYCRSSASCCEVCRKNNFQRAEQLIVAYRYLAYDFDQPFLPQYRDNMLFLKAMLEKLA